MYAAFFLLLALSFLATLFLFQFAPVLSAVFLLLLTAGLVGLLFLYDVVHRAKIWPSLPASSSYVPSTVEGHRPHRRRSALPSGQD